MRFAPFSLTSFPLFPCVNCPSQVRNILNVNLCSEGLHAAVVFAIAKILHLSSDSKIERTFIPMAYLYDIRTGRIESVEIAQLVQDPPVSGADARRCKKRKPSLSAAHVSALADIC